MKTVILAGGLGTRLSEETERKPKPMVEIGARPLLWHILSHYAHYGFKEFIIALGYKGGMIKRYFMDLFHSRGNMTVDLEQHEVRVHGKTTEDWVVHLVDTGRDTMTGGRLRRLRDWLEDEPFMVTYGDGVSDVDLPALVEFHRSHSQLATVTAVRPPARFGGIVFEGDLVDHFTEKPQTGEGWINGGFMVLEPGVLDYFEDDQSVLEVHGLEQLAAKKQLNAYQHFGFWQCMDTLREKRILERLWQSEHPPWRVWEE